MRTECEIALWLRRYPEATEVCAGALSAGPDNLNNIQLGVMIALAQGDLAGARRRIQDATPVVGQSALVAFLAQYWDLYWPLDSAEQARLVTLRPDAFDDDPPTWALVLTQVYAVRGDRARTRIYADSARAGFVTEVAATPADDQRHLLLGLSLAYLGRYPDAIREAERGAALMPISKNARDGTYDQYLLARVYLLAGQPDKAMDVLEQLLKVPFYVSPAWLRIDPEWTSLKGNPRFERLSAG
jgi:tetratricopeptide (TPR) repeat protein